jgi:hypothetical protein
VYVDTLYAPLPAAPANGSGRPALGWGDMRHTRHGTTQPRTHLCLFFPPAPRVVGVVVVVVAEHRVGAALAAAGGRARVGAAAREQHEVVIQVRVFLHLAQNCEEGGFLFLSRVFASFGAPKTFYWYPRN